MQDLVGVASVSARLEAVLSRLSGHFRSMPESKLLGRLPDGRSRAGAGHELAERVALAAQGVEERAAQVAPSWRRLPFEGPFVVGDQIGVTGHDLLAACERAAAEGGEVMVWAEGASEGIDGAGAAAGAEGLDAGGRRVRIESLLEGVLRGAEGLAGVL